jgi:DNA-binding transcriptional ArsR family regulator
MKKGFDSIRESCSGQEPCYLSLDLIKRRLYNDPVDKFSALAEPTRRSIIELLANQGELSAADICAKFEVSAAAISQHLKVLREADLVRVEKRAQQRIYRINPQAMLEVEGWARHMAQLWNERFDALDELLMVEKMKLSQDEKKDEV